MPLEVQAVEAADFDAMAKYVTHEGGDLAAPLLNLVWPAGNDDAAAAAARLQWSMKQQREIFTDDPTAHFIKVVDTDRSHSPVISLARWHRYDNGFPYPANLPFELNGTAPDADSTWPHGIDVPLAKALLGGLCAERPSWQGRRPMWVLTTLITRTGERRRGAGGMLVAWGVARAVADGVPAFVEATPAGEPVYAKEGFKRVGEHRNDLRALGIERPVVLARMAANVE